MPSFLRVRASLVPLAIAVAAWLTCCSSAPLGGAAAAPTDGDGGAEGDAAAPPLVAAPGQLALRVDAARRVVSKGVKGPLQLAVTIANGVGGKPVPLMTPLFHLKTADGRLRIPDLAPPTTGEGFWVDGRTPSVGDELGGGATFQLPLAFDIGDDAAVELTFVTPETAGVGDGRSATAPVPLVEPCAVCGDTCTYLDRDTSNCGRCGVALVGRFDTPGQKKMLCVGGKPTCASSTETACPTPLANSVVTCFDLTSGTERCGSCQTAVPAGAHCAAGKLACSQPNETPCAQGCADLSLDTGNCGTCGAVVPQGGLCLSGKIQCSDSSKVACGNTCVALASDVANCGACGHACTGAASCGRFSQGTLQAVAQPGKCDIIVGLYPFVAGKTCRSICTAKGYGCEESPAQQAAFSCPTAIGYNYKSLLCDDVIPSSIPSPPGFCSAPTDPYQSVTCTCVQP